MTHGTDQPGQQPSPEQALAAIVAATALILAPITLPTPPAPRHTPTPLPMPQRLAHNYDNHGSYWGYETVAQAEAGITQERANGTAVDEWGAADRDGQLLRIVRMADPDFLDTICVIPVSAPAVAA
ncbi:hypothetical protein GCM10010372_30800 [Streptomyces tauricus]|uniref:hypothetical protein n=1 Tax=Streptomyces tauricus TaxID=68274 RepID=UPI00167BA218|nr:hypothetical protein [Streptomyces tauricus]GHA28801.1 hypothetical protein GCM10010372_30800 [Streptomyces tauricus]